MRTNMKWTSLIPVALVAMACAEKQVDADLKRDLALVDAAQLELAPTAGANMAYVSEVENVTAPGPRVKPTPSPKRARKVPPPQVVEVDAGGEGETAVGLEMVTVAPSLDPVAVEVPAPDSAPAVRPQPIEPRFPVGTGAVYGDGRERGTGTGGVDIVVIRGGRTRHDPCAIHVPRSGGTSVMINNRIPGRPTFPR